MWQGPETNRNGRCALAWAEHGAARHISALIGLPIFTGNPNVMPARSSLTGWPSTDAQRNATSPCCQYRFDLRPFAMRSGTAWAQRSNNCQPRFCFEVFCHEAALVHTAHEPVE
jgi:hypothetical protein